MQVKDQLQIEVYVTTQRNVIFGKYRNVNAQENIRQLTGSDPLYLNSVRSDLIGN